MVEVVEPDRCSGGEGGWSWSWALIGGGGSTPEVSAKKSQNGRRFFHKADRHVPPLKAHSVGSALDFRKPSGRVYAEGMQCVPSWGDPMPMSKNKPFGGSLLRALSVLCVALGAASAAAGDTAAAGPQQASPPGRGGHATTLEEVVVTAETYKSTAPEHPHQHLRRVRQPARRAAASPRSSRSPATCPGSPCAARVRTRPSSRLAVSPRTAATRRPWASIWAISRSRPPPWDRSARWSSTRICTISTASKCCADRRERSTERARWAAPSS